MNRDLIKKFKKEFDHSLEYGSILARYYDYEDRKYGSWTELPKDFKWDNCNIYNPQYVINDEYVEFRKALLEDGKTVCLIIDSKDIKLEPFDSDKLDLRDYNIDKLVIVEDE